MANPTPPVNTPVIVGGITYQNSPTLSQIETKVRRLTRSPSTAQLSQQDLDNYINTFLVYDFPEHLRTYNLRVPFTFYTNPGQDVYNTDEASFAGATNNIMYNFQNKYLTVHDPFYIAGFQSMFCQSREQFYGIYPITNSIVSTGFLGNGSAGPFTGVITNATGTFNINTNSPGVTLLQDNVLFSAIGTYGTGEELGMALVDVPLVDAGTGFKLNIGNLYDPNSTAYQIALVTPPTVPLVGNTINYLTGVYTITFPQVTVAGTQINSQTVPQVMSLPQAVCYYNNTFIVRPVPDQAYAINFEVFQRPTALMAAGQVPELEEYWQLIAYGAAKKIFEDRMDLDSVQMIMPEYMQQMRLCLRRTIVQYTNQRVATIYTEQVNSTGASGFWGWSGSNF